jgi:hypothetical protein
MAAESSAFAWLCDEIEKATSFSKLEARGTIRIALKEVGLLVADLTPKQAVTVAERVLPRELGSRGVADAEDLCRRLAAGVGALVDERSGAAADEVFGSLTGSR